MAVVYQCTGVPMLPLISLWFPFSCPICLLELSYNFLQLPYGCLRFPAGFPIGFPLILRCPFEFLLFVYGFLYFAFSCLGCLYGFPANVLWDPMIPDGFPWLFVVFF